MTNYLDKINQLEFCDEEQKERVIELVEEVIKICGGKLEERPSKNEKMAESWGETEKKAVDCLRQFVQEVGTSPEQCILRSELVLRMVLGKAVTTSTHDRLGLDLLYGNLKRQFEDIVP